jgi:glycerophosphoryl diester phosphodiesterase
MSFESDVLKRLRGDLQVEMVQLADEHESVRPRRMQKISDYASAVGLSKKIVLPPDASGAVDGPGPGLLASFRSGLDVLVWTLRSENRHLPTNLRSDGLRRDHGDAAGEVRRLLDLGVDGLMTDFPEVAVEVRSGRAAPIAL